MESYSVLMSVYYRENPVFFEKAVQSILEQSVRTNDFVIICDGPLTPELDEILERYSAKWPDIFQIVRLENNVGIGNAANIGLKLCKNELVAKMDADDIAAPLRCEWQLSRFAQRPELTVLGGYIEEFEEDPEKPFSVRSVPLDNEAIRKFARKRQPFNNTTVMYRRSAVLQVGGYRDLRRCEDFDLYIRLLNAGYYCENLDRILVQVRVDGGAFDRRGSWETLKGCARSRWNSYRIGYASLLDVGICVCGELAIMISPNGLRRLIYHRLLRKSCGQPEQENSGSQASEE